MIPQHNYEGAAFLAYGITTTMDPSMWSHNLFPTAEMVEAGVLRGPAGLHHGRSALRRRRRRQHEFTIYEQADQSIARLQAWGAVSLKQYLQPRREQRSGSPMSPASAASR